ncbi:ABC transporter substrate-binding protein [Granulosicoccus sp. 3-233]|uniref:ABC transporter substrate-binding protein n=1 Tax=Granulosicoccus sp. 3-233 TaxID=3417969 RepID=UPI003D325D71
MLTRRRILSTAGAILAACAIAAGPATAMADPLKVGYLQFTSFGLINVAEAQQWFEEEGVDVELVLFDSGPPLLEAMIGGSIDIGALGGVPTLRTAAQQIMDLRVLSVVADVSGPSKIVSQNGIDSIEELRGKKVSIPWATTQHYIVGQALAQHGMTTDDVDLVQMEVLDAQGAFIAGRIDAFAPAPSALDRVLEARKDSRVLFATSDFTDPFFVFDLWAAPGKIIDARLEDIQKVLRVFHGKSVPYFTSPDTAEAAALDLQNWLNKVVGANLTAEQVQQQIDALTFFNVDEVKQINTDGTLADMLKKQSEFLQEVGILDSLPDFDTLLDPRVIDGL